MMDKESVFKLIQEHLKSPPTIIWGSGATFQYGMPTMGNLKEQIGITDDGNLEELLSKIEPPEALEKYEQQIFNVINKADAKFRKAKEKQVIGHLESLLSYFYKTHPCLVNIITTNYDCVLEYTLEGLDLPYSDGFNGKQFSKFKPSNFKNKEHVNLIKVHGSLRWSDSVYSYYNDSMDAIYPSKNKYKQAYQDPFRTLIQKSDEIIESANSFLIVGFGFNDEHLTPKLEAALKKGVPAVIITKDATKNTLKTLEAATKSIVITEASDNQSSFSIYNDEGSPNILLEDGYYWSICEGKGFQKILTTN